MEQIKQKFRMSECGKRRLSPLAFWQSLLWMIIAIVLVFVFHSDTGLVVMEAVFIHDYLLQRQLKRYTKVGIVNG
jgi:hypothetical protein